MDLADAVVQDLEGRPAKLAEVWKDRPAVLVFLRHFGWIMCREEAAEVRGHLDEIEKKGAKLAFVGSGSPAQAKNFAQHLQVPASVSLFTDPTLESFRAAGLRRSVFRTLGLQSLKNFFRARKKGFKQGRTQGDPWQQGGSLVVDPSGRVLYRFVSEAPGDHPPPGTLVQQLP